MFIVLLDEPGLFVFDSPDAAVQAIEPPDAENEIRAAFDDEAIPYRVEWIRPNQHNALFGSVGTVQLGEYRFVPAGPPDIAGLLELLAEHLFGTIGARPQSFEALHELELKMRAVVAVISHAQEDAVVELIARDVRSTIGGEPDRWIRDCAARLRLFIDDYERYATAVAEEVQQDIHDSFSDTAWPRCPRHPNHPLWLHDGWWRCEKDNVAIAKLGAL